MSTLQQVIEARITAEVAQGPKEDPTRDAIKAGMVACLRAGGTPRETK